jgi:hypothetical protein
VKFDLGAPIVAWHTGGGIQWTRLHLPVDTRTYGLRGSFSHTIEQAIDRCTLEWESLCGLPGWLYAYGGPIRRERIPFCTVCIARANELASAEYRARRRALRVAA